MNLIATQLKIFSAVMAAGVFVMKPSIVFSQESPEVQTEIGAEESVEVSPTVSTQKADAEPGEADPAKFVVEVAPNHSQSWALGLNLAWLSRRDYGASTYRRFSPEIVAYYYGELPWQDTFWRAGARLGYTRDQPEMPQAVRIEETDTLFAVEAGIVREWYLVPSFSWGLGYDFRTTKLKTNGPVDFGDDRFNRKERLLVWYLQTGLGMPIYRGMFMIEPVLRYHTIEYDDRSHWLVGFETTFGF